MSRSFGLGSLSALLLASLLFLFIACSQPVSPYLLSNTKIFLVGKDSKGGLSGSLVDDSIGNTISIGFYSNLPGNLDSVQLKLSSLDIKDSVFKVFRDFKSLKLTDTLWNAMAFDGTGSFTLTGTAYIYGFATPYSDSIPVVIHGKPQNHKPHIIVTGLTTISMGQQCSFIVTVNDSDKLQKDSILMLSAPSGAVFNAGTFLWTPVSGFTGMDTAVFIAWDNGYPVMFDTIQVFITVTGSLINHAPHWQDSIVNEVGIPGNAISIALLDKCTDPDGDPLTFSLLTGLPSTDSIANAATAPTYTFTPGLGDTGVFTPRIVATDPKGASDTLTINLNIHVIVIDSLQPAMTLMSPAKDSASVSSSALAVKISCSDPSGVASVKCSIGADTFPLAHSDSTYTAAISGLKQGVMSAITFIAVDASSRANRGTLVVHVKYDSTVADDVPPSITLISPSKDTVIAADSSVVKVKCTDASGIQSVIYTVGTQSFTATKSTPTDSIYSGTIKGLMGGAASTVTITATDASPAHNAATATVKITYDNDKTAPVLRLFPPTKDSMSVSGNAASIQVVCTDASGIASLTCNAGATSYPMTKSTSADSLWSGNITGLIAGQMAALTLVATDGSLSGNKMTLVMHIKYDPNMTDATGPTITKVSGLATGGRTANTLDTLVYTVTDPSGVDTVSWTLNGAPEGVLTASANGRYSINAVLSAPHTNTIILIAYDKSPNHNKSVDTTVINYNRPPVISGAHDTTIQALSTLQFTVSATDPEGDKVTLSAPTLPSGATFNASTGAFSWIPAVTQSGANATIFKANDGLDTTTKTISIVVSNMPPPSITKNPAPDTACLGSPASFSITASGTGLTYQWQNAAGNLSGAHFSGIATNSLSINTVTAGDSGVYSCLVTNAAGGIATSSGAKLTVNIPSGSPSAVATPDTMCAGNSTVLSVSAGSLGTGAAWKWYASKTGTSLTSTTITLSTTTMYYVRGEGTCGNSPWDSIQVMVNPIPAKPTNAAATSPICSGGTSTLSATSPTSGATLHWFTGSCGGASVGTGASLTTGALTAATTFYVHAESGSCFSACTSVTVAIKPGPSIQTQPITPQNLSQGSALNLTVAASGSATLTYQWKKGSSNVSNGTGGTTNSYSISSVVAGDAGSYTCVVTDGCGQSLTSAASVVAVAPTYTVTYNSNSSTGGSVPVDPNTYANGATVTVLDNTGANKLVKTGAIFSGWNTNNGGTGTQRMPGSTFAMGSANVILYAVWTPVFTVSYNSNGGSGSAPSDTTHYTQGATVTVKGSNGLTRTAFTFVGWNTLANGTGTNYPVNSGTQTFTMATSNVTLYANWDVRDIDGNHYDTVRIGTQTWMVQNFRCTKLNDGTPITLENDGSQWAALMGPGYCYYNNTTNADNIKKFGALYNSLAAFSNKLAPTGWKVPNDGDWGTLQNYLIANGYNYDGTTSNNLIAKSVASTTDWATDVTGTPGAPSYFSYNNNTSGFSGIPGGLLEGGAGFVSMDSVACWWTSTQLGPSSNSNPALDFNNASFTTSGVALYYGCSIRLLRN